MAKPNVIVICEPGASLSADFEAVEAVANLIPVDNADDLRRAQERAEIALLWDFATPLLKEAGPGNLAWIHTNSIGVDAIVSPEVVQSRALISNTRGVFERPVAEWALAAWLFLAKSLRRTVEQQRAGEWKPYAVGLSAGRRAIVLGPGHVGRETTLLLRGAGATVDVVGRQARDNEPGLGRVHAVSELDALLPEADDVVLALPHTAETDHILDAARIGLLPDGAHVINVGRGALVDESALLAALQAGKLGGAALDVFEREPLPAEHPFWTMDNVLVSPHMSGEVAGWERGVLDLFLANLERFLAKEELENLVDKRQLAVAHAAG